MIFTKGLHALIGAGSILSKPWWNMCMSIPKVRKHHSGQRPALQASEWFLETL